MQELNKQFDGRLQMALDIFTNVYPKKFLYQLVSGQLDVDRMDYLTRDSFFSGVSEGVIGYDRILKMLTVHNGELMVEEKGIYSIEKFLVSRRLMYWQVYLHKTVLCAEQMLQRIIRRAKFVKAPTQLPLHQFINEAVETVTLEQFCNIDDYDVVSAIKGWCKHEDVVLSFLSQGIINRNLLKVKYFAEPVSEKLLEEKTAEAMQKMGLSAEDAAWLVFKDEKINILFKDGSVNDISEVDDALINQNLSGNIKKYYICYLRS
jgi:uncharacterized protein